MRLGLGLWRGGREVAALAVRMECQRIEYTVTSAPVACPGTACGTTRAVNFERRFVASPYRFSDFFHVVPKLVRGVGGRP